MIPNVAMMTSRAGKLESTPTVIFVAGDKSLLVPGAHMVIFAHRNPDNSLVALGIVAEKDGVVPPM